MAISRSLKGMHNLKTMHTRKKEKESNYLKLYILDKERTRLRSEQIRLNLRLEVINERLKEIEDFHKSVVEQKQPETDNNQPDPEKTVKGKQWKTMSIDY
jgi:predicted nuclease with TOPRIM domain